MMFIDLYACWCDVPILILIFMDVHSLHFYRFSLIFIGFHECSLNFIDFHRCLLIFIYFHRCPCMFIDFIELYWCWWIIIQCYCVSLSFTVCFFNWLSLLFIYFHSCLLFMFMDVHDSVLILCNFHSVDAFSLIYIVVHWLWFILIDWYWLSCVIYRFS